MIESVIFDVDGTLVDSVDLHARAWRDAFRHFGKDIPVERVRTQIGKGSDQLLPVFLTPEEIRRFGADLDAHRGDLWKRKFLHRVAPFPHVRDLFELLRARGKRIALASSAKADELAHYEKVARIHDLVDVRTSADDADQSKPKPDIFEAALDRLGNPAKHTAIVVGDTPWDAIAATRAGLKSIGVLCGGWDPVPLREAGFMAVYHDPEDLLLRYLDSPFDRMEDYERHTMLSEFLP